MKLLIDGKEVQIASSTHFTFDIEAPAAAQLHTPLRQMVVEIPCSAANAAVIGDIEYVHSTTRFNDGVHTAEIQVRGCTVLQGIAHLESVRREQATPGWYRIAITDPLPKWIEKARSTTLTRTQIEFAETISAKMIRESWSWGKPVRMLPVQRDTLLVQNISGTTSSAVRVLSSEDYHPFIHLATLIEKIIGSDYTICSSLMDNEIFRSLYISGNYPEQDVEALKQGLDFRAGCFANRSASADQYGTVRANPFSTISSIGNIVETANPEQTQSGVTAAGVFNTNNAFRTVNGRVCFVPLKEVNVGFEYNLFYRTPYTILSRDELSGFNYLFLGGGDEHEFKITNRFIDRRSSLSAGKNYLCVVFDHASGNSYQLRYGTGTVLTTFSARTASVTLPSTTITNLQLWSRKSSEGTYSLSSLDWALYDGYITATGYTDVEVTLRTGAETITPSDPKYFDDIYFGGATAGNTLTLYKESYVRPLFQANPSIGSYVEFADMAAHTVKQSQIVEAVAHMFDLRIRTDELSRTVYIEPFSHSVEENISDWSTLTDFSKPIEVSESGADHPCSTTYGYQSGDGVTKLYNADNSTHFGQWEATVANSLARNKQATSTNLLFHPTVSFSGGYPDAPTAQFMQAGERSSYSIERSDSLNFPMKIVRYCGIANLPTGEKWGWPSYSRQYPLAGFHLRTDYGFTLCFENRDGYTGLHEYYDRLYRSLNSGRTITAYMHLSPAHIEALVTPVSSRGGLDAAFTINVDGQDALCRLIKVCGYNPGCAESTKCIFQTIE